MKTLTCVAYVHRWPQSSGPCGAKAKYLAHRSRPETLEATCGRHVHKYINLGWEIIDL